MTAYSRDEIPWTLFSKYIQLLSLARCVYNDDNNLYNILMHLVRHLSPIIDIDPLERVGMIKILFLYSCYEARGFSYFSQTYLHDMHHID